MAARRSRSGAARVPACHGSTTNPPQATVECTRVPASPAMATWVIRSLPSVKKSRSPARIALGGTGAPQTGLLARVPRKRDAAGREGGLHQPRAVHAPRSHSTPLVGCAGKHRRLAHRHGGDSRLAAMVAARSAMRPARGPARPGHRAAPLRAPRSSARARSGSRTLPCPCVQLDHRAFAPAPGPLPPRLAPATRPAPPGSRRGSIPRSHRHRGGRGTSRPVARAAGPSRPARAG